MPASSATRRTQSTTSCSASSLRRPPPMRMNDWRDLPFREIWALDTEFYPGPGLSNGGRDGDPTTPLCLVALEMRTGRLIRLWQDELGPFSPFRRDSGACLFGYMLAAEF